MTVEVIGRRPAPPPRRRRPSWFWWILVNVAALCLAVLPWVACLYVFNRPERPDNYRLLERIGRAPELKAFTALDAPDGTPADPRSLYRKFVPLKPRQVAVLNPRLLRNYLENIKQPLLNTYVEGEFRVEEVRPLAVGDFFFPGIAVRARAEVRSEKSNRPAPYPVWVDLLFPTDHPEAGDQFAAGEVLGVAKVPNCISVLRVDLDKTGDEPRVYITAVPLAYGDCAIGGEPGFPIAPPARVNPAARLPAFPVVENGE